MIDGLLLSIVNRVIPMLTDDASGILVRPGTDTNVTDVVTDVANGLADAVPPPAVADQGNWWIMIIYAGLFIVALYFMMFRGPRRREKKMKELQANIRTGDNVVVSGGMFGRVADVGDDCFIVEFGTNRGVRIPVLKSDVLGVREPKLTPPPKEVVADK